MLNLIIDTRYMKSCYKNFFKENVFLKYCELLKFYSLKI